MSLAERLGVHPQVVERVGLLQSPYLAEPDVLLDAARVAYKAKDAEQAQALLAAALLSASEKTDDGRHMAALSLLSRLVARADPEKSLGEGSAHARADCMPNGWKYTIVSFERLRYAWRCGLEEMLGPWPADLVPTVQALDEVTRMNPAEPEPTKVTIQDRQPGSDRAQLVISLAGLTLVAFGTWRATRGIAAAKKTTSKKSANKRKGR